MEKKVTSSIRFPKNKQTLLNEMVLEYHKYLRLKHGSIVRKPTQSDTIIFMIGATMPTLKAENRRLMNEMNQVIEKE